MMQPASFDRLLWWSPGSAPDHPQTKTIHASLADVRVRDTDTSRPTVVFLCDPPVMVEHYDELIEELGSDYRIVVVELPGFGFSKSHSTEALEFQGSVSAVESALSQLITEPMVICAPCICGFVGAELVHRGNLNIAGLVLIQTPDFDGMVQWTERMDSDGRLRKPYLGQLLMRATARRMTKKWFSYATGEGTRHAPMAEKSLNVLSSGGSYPLATIFQTWESGLENHGLEVPALGIWGQQDRSHDSTERKSTLKHVSEARVTEFEQCGHFPELEDPAAFAEEVTPFLREVFGQDVKHDATS
jgi:pimeloyl-ACP methyl ester carboxylesterase